ncbi:MAG: class I SAM-dependent methyltransferase [Bacteroidota bacterium]
MNRDAIVSVYRRYAPFYDLVFGKMFDPGRRTVLDQLNCQSEEHILEVGVGTGLSLPNYPNHCKVIGIDISPEMLNKAAEKAQALDHVDVMVMDAQNMSFPDNHFDKLALMYVVSVVPDHQQLMLEVKRVCKPGGDILILNHFTSPSGPMRWIEKSFSKVADKLGWHPDFDPTEFIEANKLEVLNTLPVNLFGYWKVLHIRNNK